LKYATGTFDSQVEFIDGKKKGEKRGLQSWNYYVIPAGDSIAKFKKKPHARTEFGLAAFHYFFELVDRLRKVDLITYAGEKEFNGKTYELVFVTWGKLKTHKKHDQYMLWINKQTSLLEYCEFTIHDSFLPGGNTIPGSIEFTSLKEINGVKIPFEQYVYIGSPKKKHSKYLHKLTVTDFKFDSFDLEELYPNKDLKRNGDNK
jgi:hypothetical protein